MQCKGTDLGAHREGEGENEEFPLCENETIFRMIPVNYLFHGSSLVSEGDQGCEGKLAIL